CLRISISPAIACVPPSCPLECEPSHQALSVRSNGRRADGNAFYRAPANFGTGRVRTGNELACLGHLARGPFVGCGHYSVAGFALAWGFDVSVLNFRGCYLREFDSAMTLSMRVLRFRAVITFCVHP